MECEAIMGIGIYEKIIASGVILFGAAALAFARRYKNNDSDAGQGVAGWSIFIVFLIWVN